MPGYESLLRSLTAAKLAAHPLPAAVWWGLQHQELGRKLCEHQIRMSHGNLFEGFECFNNGAESNGGDEMALNASSLKDAEKQEM